MSGRRRRALRPEQHLADSTAGSGGRASIAGWILLGLVMGLAAGLWYAWMADPVVFVEVSPARFSERYKAEYILLVSQSYAANGDRPLAERRMAALDDPSIAQTVADLLETHVREQRPAGAIRNLALLAQQLGADTRAVALFAPTPLPGSGDTPAATPEPSPTPAAIDSPTPTVTISPTNTPPPTATPTATIQASPTPPPNYRLLGQERVCPPDSPAPRIEVITQDALLNPLPGVEVLVRWEGGTDRFYTGFKPIYGPSYGDFTMSHDVSYTVVLAEGSEAVSGLRVEACDNGLDGGWRLTFQNLRLRATATPGEGE